MNALLAALRAVAEPTRLRLFALCAGGEWTVSELVGILRQSQPRVSRHLKLLTDAGLLERFGEGSWVFHRLIQEGAAAGIARRLLTLLPEDDRALALDRERLAEVKWQRSQAAATYFARNAESWDRLRSLHADDAKVERTIKKLLPLRQTDELLDLGTGTGRMLEIFAPDIHRGRGVDLSCEMLAVARANLERTGAANCTVRQADIYQPPFRENCFDAVTIHQVLHFLDDPGRAIALAARMLRPGGRMLIVDFAPHDIEELRLEHEHRRLGFGDKEVAAWFAAAHLKHQRTVHLPGDPLTVSLWLASAKAAGKAPKG
ncbi:MAG: metalloregulator ArsR/SmtB family transcription factor [Rhodospirillales bacterium]|jgi:ArsR family transcriptional regulator|nr:metalloregulator ArsR/SmtB family transcription factor [Rhodospirillales bacterium]HIJ44394.1 metalloregulator ArsR/SmtB family transcription factor [Rhodospirillaceae bacterium]MDP7097164.1 metalloregulator ArsR/SmtB family transcription factor [Rhodospirillales bacterium]MDP7214643.1 metalloregulator ArsR/SmtB family transcription factor [Rhodospirillales bacterium]HIJ94117.1 metalloregulator ArsR/SmtB family transcription factor [Rhodospirillaceae bacterium]